MLIPKHLLELMAAGCQFEITVTGNDKRRYSFHQPKQPGFAVKLTVVEEKVNKTADEVEILEAFKRFDMMSVEQRDKEGCRKHDLGMIVALAGRFARTFNAERYAVEKKTAYCGMNGVKMARFCYVIPREIAPKSDEVEQTAMADLSSVAVEPTPSAADAAAMDLARATLANRDAEPSQLVEVTGMSLPALLDLATPPAWPHLPPLASD